MSAHTPGPWKATPWEDRYPLKECGGDGKSLPKTFWWITRGEDFAAEATGWMPEADARLIAAAPELLDALKLLLGHSGLDIDAQDKDPEDHAAERIARAAIAKATGERK